GGGVRPRFPPANDSHKELAAMQTITRDELRKRLDQDRQTKLIEVLPQEEFSSFHLPGAVNVPLLSSDFDRTIERIAPDEQQPIVVYCKNMSCDASRKAAARLDELGYRNVFAYEAGKEDWKKAGLPVESGSRPRTASEAASSSSQAQGS